MAEHAISASRAWGLTEELMEDERMAFAAGSALVDDVMPKLLRYSVPDESTFRGRISGGVQYRWTDGSRRPYVQGRGGGEIGASHETTSVFLDAFGPEHLSADSGECGPAQKVIMLVDWGELWQLPAVK